MLTKIVIGLLFLSMQLPLKYVQKIEKIYLHWTATNYSWCKAGFYHTIITGDGVVHHLTNNHTPLDEHTFKRNVNSIGIAVACMLNGDFKHYGPTEAQLDSLAKETAKICCGLGWEANEKFLEFRVMTHAECAANRDFPIKLVEKFSHKNPSSDWDHAAQDAGLPHANYSIANWYDSWPGGDSYRWDLSQLRLTDRPGIGGYEMRTRIVAWMIKIKKDSK